MKCFRDISSWLQNDWYSHMKELPINNVVPANDNVSGTSTETNAVENERSNHTHDDLAYNFIDPDEDMNNAIENETEF